ncbi:MAG: DHH family phosphoesterase [Candidatus Aenigmarchaeota archaeon]|nr:DHH family phosphoesterase [Candidatus Aenigmarchaeota archaeon]
MARYFSNAVKFLKDVKKTDSVVIIFNNDADGISSCALIDMVLKEKGVKPYIISQPMPTEKNLIRKIQTTIPTKLIFLDLAMDQQETVIKKLTGISDILIVDHHSVHSDLNTPGVVHYNPRFEGKDIYQSTTYIAYKMTSEIKDMTKHLWIAAVGMIGDYNLDYSQDVVEEVRKAYPDITGKKPLYESFLGRIADMIASTRATNALSCEEMVSIMEKAEILENFKETPGSEKMQESYRTIENEIMSIEQDFGRNAETHGNLILYNLKTRFNLCSPLSTRLSEKFMDKMLVIYQISGGKVHASARNQGKKFDVASTMKKAARGLKASAGGHPAAAGATVAEKEWNEFKERLIAAMKK